MINEDSINPVTRTPVSFKLSPQPSQMILAHADSYHSRHSEFAQNAVWVTRYQEDEFFPSGMYTMQSRGGDSIASAIARRRLDDRDRNEASIVRSRDIVAHLWLNSQPKY